MKSEKLGQRGKKRPENTRSLVNGLSKKEAAGFDPSGQRWAEQVGSCVKLGKQIGYKWVRVPPV